MEYNINDYKPQEKEEFVPVKVEYKVFDRVSNYNANDIFTVNEPYLVMSDYQRLDLFKDESVSITDSVKNVKDVAKIFTPFS